RKSPRPGSICSWMHHYYTDAPDRCECAGLGGNVVGIEHESAVARRRVRAHPGWAVAHRGVAVHDILCSLGRGTVELDLALHPERFGLAGNERIHRVSIGTARIPSTALGV